MSTYYIKNDLLTFSEDKSVTIPEIEKECGFSKGYFKNIRFNIPEEDIKVILEKFPDFSFTRISSYSFAEYIEDILNDVYDDAAENTKQKSESGITGIPTGYKDIDKITYGLQPANLIVVAGRPSVGKTAFLLTMTRNMTVDYKIPVAFFSTESTSKELVKRLILSESGLPKERLEGKMTKDEFEQFYNGMSNFFRTPLWIDDTPGMPLNELVRKIKELRYKCHIRLAIVDCLQMVNGPYTPYPSREQEITAICRKLKETAMELNMPIVVASQNNRAVEIRGGNKRPQLNDLRESGAIEQIADVVMFIHRPEFLGVHDEGGFPGETDLIIAKNRNGETGEVKMRFLSSEVKFVDYNELTNHEGDSPGYTTVQSRMNEILDKDDFEL